MPMPAPVRVKALAARSRAVRESSRNGPNDYPAPSRPRPTVPVVIPYLAFPCAAVARRWRGRRLLISFDKLIKTYLLVSSAANRAPEAAHGPRARREPRGRAPPHRAASRCAAASADAGEHPRERETEVSGPPPGTGKVSPGRPEPAQDQAPPSTGRGSRRDSLSTSESALFSVSRVVFPTRETRELRP